MGSGVKYMSLVTQIEYKAFSDIQQICHSHNTCETCPFYKPEYTDRPDLKSCLFMRVTPSAWDITKILDTLYNERTIKGV